MATEFRGNLYVFVDVQETEPPRTTFGEIFGNGEPGGIRWYSTGWAVGRSAQGRYCSRTSLSKARRFSTFAEAMDFVRARRKARPLETFHLVYELDGHKRIVTSLEQIQRCDGTPVQPSSGEAADGTADPVMERLAAKVGKVVASNALTLRRILGHEGEAVARSRFSAATYDRLWQVLEDAGLTDGLPATTREAMSESVGG